MACLRLQICTLSLLVLHYAEALAFEPQKEAQAAQEDKHLAAYHEKLRTSGKTAHELREESRARRAALDGRAPVLDVGDMDEQQYWEEHPSPLTTYLAARKEKLHEKAVDKQALKSLEEIKKHEAAMRVQEEKRQKQEAEKEAERRLHAEDDTLWKSETLRRKAEAARKHEAELAKAQLVKGRRSDERQHEVDLKNTEKAKAWAKAHYRRSEPGEPCPDGFQAVITRMHCKLAQKALDLVDDIDYRPPTGALDRWEDRPNGCFLHYPNGHVNFNDQEGAFNLQDASICEPVNGKIPGIEA